MNELLKDESQRYQVPVRPTSTPTTTTTNHGQSRTVSSSSIITSNSRHQYQNSSRPLQQQQQQPPPPSRLSTSDNPHSYYNSNTNNNSNGINSNSKLNGKTGTNQNQGLLVQGQNGPVTKEQDDGAKDGDGDEDESDVDLDFEFEPHHHDEQPSKIPLVSIHNSSNYTTQQTKNANNNNNNNNNGRNVPTTNTTTTKFNNNNNNNNNRRSHESTSTFSIGTRYSLQQRRESFDVEYGDIESHSDRDDHHHLLSTPTAHGGGNGNGLIDNNGRRRGDGYAPIHPTDEDGEEMMQQQPKLPDEGGSIFSSFLNMANSIIGAGIIGLPFAFQEAGLGMGIILLCGITFVVDWTVRLLVHNGKLSGRNTYQDLLMFCFGKAGLIAISVFQFVFAFGAMCAYTVIVGDTLPHVLQALIPGIETWPWLGFLARRSFVIMICTVLISLPLSLYRDISKLAKTSAVAMLALVVIIIAVLIEGPRAPIEIRGDPDAVWSFARPELFQSIGVISFAFVCHHNSFLIFGSLQKPTMNRVEIVTHMSMAVSLLACMILALSGYLSFSDKTQGNILNNFPRDNFLINIARFCFGINMFTTFPLETFVCREVIETYYFPGQSFNYKRHAIITTSLVGVALLIALLTCDLGFVLEFTGGFSATALAFILPPLCYLKLASGNLWTRKKLAPLACLGFGLAVMTLSTFFSIKHFLAPKEPSVCSV